jgi:hypothetical protein
MELAVSDSELYLDNDPAFPAESGKNRRAL